MGKRKQKNSIFMKFGALGLAMVLLLGILTGYFAGTQSREKEEVLTPTPSAEPAIKKDYSTMAKEEMVNQILEDMTLEEMVYQMMFVTPEAITHVGTAISAGDATKAAIQKYPVGGIIYFSANFKSREQTAEMIQNTQSYSKIPLFISVDEEGGRVSRLGSNADMGTTKHPTMKSIGESGDPQKAYEIGKTLAIELKELGFNVDFAPDADVLVNKNNTEIGDRSFGSDPQMVAKMVEQVVLGLEENGVSGTLKHFPGHGSTYVNSHSGYSESKRTMEELWATELIPFEAGIGANVDFIMVSHATMVDATEEKVPCSISKEMITDLLLDELNYQGIVITDSFSMGAITENYTPEEATVKAVLAGVDMILMPADLERAHTAIMEAVEEGTISEERIKESVRKIITLKVKKGMF